jgi:hypothetical protein
MLIALNYNKLHIYRTLLPVTKTRKRIEMANTRSLLRPSTVMDFTRTGGLRSAPITCIMAWKEMKEERGSK